MKKATIIFTALALICASFTTIGTYVDEVNELTSPHMKKGDMVYIEETFSNLDVNDVGEYLSLHLEGCVPLFSPGEPMIPMYNKIIAFPPGTKIERVEVLAYNVEEKFISKKIMPAYEPVPPDMRSSPFPAKEDKIIYESDSAFPEDWYEYNTMGGIRNGNHVTFLALTLYPLHYTPSKNTIKWAHTMDIEITYTLPKKPLFQNDKYDLIIISPSEFLDALQPLIQHKENHGLKTKLVTLDEIYGETYFMSQGRDDAEKVKYFIKNAIEEWGIDYVLLVGGRKPGIQEEWLLPVRYVHVYWVDESTFISDLYYADIYDAEYTFSSWDTDENNVFSEWGSVGSLKDEIDLYPDVHIGRWACRSEAEVDIMVEKTIRYESTPASKRIVLAGGDNFEMEGIEGEIVCDKSLSYLSGFEAEKVYVSLGDVTSKAMKDGLNKGAAFIHLHGHGSPIYWSTHKVDGFDKWEDGLKVYDLHFFFNEEYPIAVIGGCHTAMFNMSMTVHPWTGGIPYPGGLSWIFARKYDGGAIASLGYTAFPVATPGEDGDLDGDGINEPDCMESGYGYMQLELFYAYGEEGLQHLGECWGYAVSTYVEHFKIPYERWHLHTIQSFVLLGDPSLKIGGYP